MDSHMPIPFFMAYPGVVPDETFTERLSDREYMRQLYPREVKRYLVIVSDALDQIDFDESYIYDEYPDQETLLRVTEFILRSIPARDYYSRDIQQSLIQVLLYEEILRRREGKRR